MSGFGYAVTVGFGLGFFFRPLVGAGASFTATALEASITTSPFLARRVSWYNALTPL
ncbi:hypothetical protein D3C72_2376160 [compost metagenome]